MLQALGLAFVLAVSPAQASIHSVAIAEAARAFRQTAGQSLAPVQPAAPAPAAAPEPVIETFEDGSWRIYDPDSLRPGHPLFDLEMRADCSVYYHGSRVQPRGTGEYGQDGYCEFLPTVHRSPSGRWIAVHTPGDHYGYDQIAVVNGDTRAVAVAPTNIAREGRLFPLKVWSADENLLLMTEMTYLGPYVGGLTQFSVSVPCEFDIARASLDCVSKQHFLESLQAAAVRASPLARCLSRRTCYMVMGTRDERLEDDGFAYTGVVQLKSLDGDPASLAEEFVTGEDIVWFEFSGRGPRNTPRDLTMRVVRQ